MHTDAYRCKKQSQETSIRLLLPKVETRAMDEEGRHWQLIEEEVKKMKSTLRKH